MGSLESKIREAVEDGRLPYKFSKPPHTETTTAGELATMGDSYTLYRELMNEYAYATECQLATLQILEDRKRSSQAELRRQRKIVESMIDNCRRHRIEAAPSKLPRLAKALSEPA